MCVGNMRSYQGEPNLVYWLNKGICVSSFPNRLPQKFRYFSDYVAYGFAKNIAIFGDMPIAFFL